MNLLHHMSKRLRRSALHKFSIKKLMTILMFHFIHQVTLKAEKMTAILHQFLPNGQLQFMNHKVVAQYEKQLEKILAIK